MKTLSLFITVVAVTMVTSAATTTALRYTGAFNGKAPVSIIQEDALSTNVVASSQASVVAVIVKTKAKKEYIVPFGTSVKLKQQNLGNVELPDSLGRYRIGGGSGFFVSSDGLIVTNRHVVDATSTDISVRLMDGREFPAERVGEDPFVDIAFLHVTGTGFLPLRFSVEPLRAGQTVLAIGNALDEFPNSVTKGIVSGLNRRLWAQDIGGSEVIEEAIQTDAAINPGNSGGPLLNLAGEVVGMNTAVSESGQLLGFALPSRLLLRDMESMKKFQRIVRPYMGVRYDVVTPELAEREAWSVTAGAYIIGGTDGPGVIPNGPAFKAGIQEGDIITEVNGEKISDEISLGTLLGRYEPGDVIHLMIIREGKKTEITLTLEEYHPE